MATLETMADDIRSMRVRGAGKIARHAAKALAAWADATPADSPAAFDRGLDDAVDALLATRPSAVSLRNAVHFVQRRAHAAEGLEAKRDALHAAVRDFVDRSERAVDAIGRHGAAHVEDGGTYLTHCNSQAALSVFKRAWADGKRFRVFATETRPWRQGHLTSRQLAEAGLDVTFIVDSAAFGRFGDLDGVFVGCDTIAANGDVVNKVGTGWLALAAREFGVPFRVCGETYKVALDVPRGADVPIEEREIGEVTDGHDLHEGVRVFNPVFDVTPNAWITELVTELGPVLPKDVASLARKQWA